MKAPLAFRMPMRGSLAAVGIPASSMTARDTSGVEKNGLQVALCMSYIKPEATNDATVSESISSELELSLSPSNKTHRLTGTIPIAPEEVSVDEDDILTGMQEEPSRLQMSLIFSFSR